MTDFRKLFKPDKFLGVLISAEAVSKQAQSILNEALDKATVVYGNGKQMDVVNNASDCDTHKALLIQVESIKECAHINYVPLFSIDGTFSDLGCVNCGKKIIPTAFKVKE